MEDFNRSMMIAIDKDGRFLCANSGNYGGWGNLKHIPTREIRLCIRDASGNTLDASGNILGFITLKTFCDKVIEKFQLANLNERLNKEIAPNGTGSRTLDVYARSFYENERRERFFNTPLEILNQVFTYILVKIFHKILDGQEKYHLVLNYNCGNNPSIKLTESGVKNSFIAGGSTIKMSKHPIENREDRRCDRNDTYNNNVDDTMFREFREETGFDLRKVGYIVPFETDPPMDKWNNLFQNRNIYRINKEAEMPYQLYIMGVDNEIKEKIIERYKDYRYNSEVFNLNFQYKSYFDIPQNILNDSSRIALDWVFTRFPDQIPTALPLALPKVGQKRLRGAEQKYLKYKAKYLALKKLLNL